MGKYESFTFSETASAASSFKSRRGCFVKATTGVIFVSVTVAIVIGVGLIVHFTEKDQSPSCDKDEVQLPGHAAADTAGKGQTKAPGTTSAPVDWSQTCKNMATGNENGICQSCPQSTCPPQLTGAPPAAKSTPTPPVEFIRLPKTIEPVDYDLVVTPNFYGADPESFTFDGSVNIKIKCKNATDKIIIHSKQLIIREWNLTPEVAPEDIKIDGMTEDTTQQLLTFTLNKNMLPTNFYHLTIKFAGPLKTDLAGLYLSSYQEGGETKYLATTQFQPTDARKAFPCFDEPGFKAVFRITLLRQEGWHSLSNSPIASTEDRNGMKADIFAPTLPMSTYLVAYVVSQFQHSSGTTKNNITYGAWAKPESVPYTQEALRLGINIITFYEELFDIKFPLAKQDMIAIPDYPLGGMENWGLVTYREEAMLYNPKTNSEYTKQRVTKVIAHELSHQWFGDLVTMQWWDDLWLNEGFATYMEYVGTNFSHPDWNIFDQFAVGDLYDAFDFDGHRTSEYVIFVQFLTIPPDVQESVYCTAIASGGWEPWNFALEQLTKTIDVAQISLIQRALACSREPWILRHYLTLALNSTYVRSQDTLTVVEHVAGNQIGATFAWTFLVENWEYIRSSFGGAWFSFDRLISSLTRSFNTESELKKSIKSSNVKEIEPNQH
ncbi:aminopeptidase N-like [Argopecten irradians]|uniref:aminopeptidase N-like n=1 Tax=Argopecten irradians TaxID=31199 RepID=UPI00371ED4BA